MVIAQIIMDQTVFSHLANTGSKMFVNALLNNLAFMFIQESLILKKTVNLLSQCPTSGRWAHCTPVWLRERSSRQQTRVKMGVANASHFSELRSDLGWAECWKFLERMRYSLSSPGTLVSLKNLQQTSWSMMTHNVLSRKYQVWCSSSTKLLAAKLRVCPTVPSRSKTSSPDSEESLPLLISADCEKETKKKKKWHLEKRVNYASLCSFYTVFTFIYPAFFQISKWCNWEINTQTTEKSRLTICLPSVGIGISKCSTHGNNYLYEICMCDSGHST